jgi:hypothetical protein
LVALGGEPVLFAAILFAGGAFRELLISEPLAKQRMLCDKAVSTLLTTTDAAELQRAMFLVHRLDCKISTRP